MPKSLLDQLSAMTVVVADTGDIRSIEKFKPRDATTNPSLITAAAQMPEYADIVDGALRWAQKQNAGDATAHVKLAIDRLSVAQSCPPLASPPVRPSLAAPSSALQLRLRIPSATVSK